MDDTVVYFDGSASAAVSRDCAICGLTRLAYIRTRNVNICRRWKVRESIFIEMHPQQFLDTAPGYGPMRVADDCVDDVDDFAESTPTSKFDGMSLKCCNAGSVLS